MSNYWHRRRYKPRSPENVIFLLLFLLILSIFYPPIRSVIYPFLYVYALIILLILVIVGYKIYHYKKLSKAGIFEIDKMDGKDFELFLTSLFSKLGYKVKHVGKIGDLGTDLILEINNIKIAVQAKRYTDNVGPNAIREINTVLAPRNCTLGMVVTNSFYTKEAKYLAKANNITLWDRDDLVNNILKSREPLKI